MEEKIMEKLLLKWSLNEGETAISIERYCHNCGKKMMFKDSSKRRKNANGKNIFEFAIFKCENGHTWNQMLGIYKSNEERKRMYISETRNNEKPDIIEIAKCKVFGIKEIEIVLTHVDEQWRFDKLLAQQIEQTSRS
jgi:hypothetical protein